jgi:uncharacterized protein (TIGR02265 family)
MAPLENAELPLSTTPPPVKAPGAAVAPALIFSQTVEGLLRALGPLSEPSKARFRDLGVDPDGPLAPAYPVEQWLELMKLGVEVMTPELPFEEGLVLLGRRFVDGYGLTLMGKAMLMAMRLFGPQRTLARFSRNLSTGSNFFESKVSQFAPGQWALWINRVTWPGWYYGIIARGLEHAGASEVKVSLLSHEGEGLAACLLVSWSEA